MVSYLRRHWRGELRPAVTWWVNCVALTVLLWFAIPQLADVLDVARAETAGKFSAAFGLRLFQIGLVPLWQMVGLWRSSEIHIRSEGGVLVGALTKVTAFLFTLLITMRGLVFGAEAVISSRVAFAIGDYRYTVELLPGGREIAVKGGLGYGVSRAVDVLLDEHPGVRRIRLDSGGGALSEGVRLRTLIMDRQLDTYSGRECSSACVSAFIGGRFRYLQRGAKMGLHLPRNWETFSTSPVTATYFSELKYFRGRGVPDWFLTNWLQTGSQFWYPTPWQLRRSGLVTGFRGVPPQG